MEEINVRRQGITLRILSEAKEKALALKDRRVLVIMGKDWHKGVVGLVAGRIAEEFHKPTIVLEEGETEATGSARTVGGFNVVEALEHASEHLIRFGGHKQAAGLTLHPSNFSAFYQNILDYAEKNLDEDFKVKLGKQQTTRDNVNATSNIKGNAGNSQSKNTVEHWVSLGKPPTAEQVPDRKLRAKILRGFMAGSKSGKKFYND